jgi:hypothetical protein
MYEIRCRKMSDCWALLWLCGCTASDPELDMFEVLLGEQCFVRWRGYGSSGARASEAGPDL